VRAQAELMAAPETQGPRSCRQDLSKFSKA
jgi:hypothetical protein